MKNDDPWTQLKTPAKPGALTARRVDAENPWDFFWAVDTDSHVLLILKHAPESAPQPPRFPRLRGMEVLIEGGASDPTLVFRLLDAAHRDIFARLCKDIVERSSATQTEVEAVAVAVNRTWRWHYLLRGGRDGRLSTEEQKGLIGELFVLDRFLLGRLPAVGAVDAWRGPTNAAHDFVIRDIRIESKAARGHPDLRVHVSSEYQLTVPDGTSKLFLHVLSLTRPQTDNDDASSVTDYATALKQRLGQESVLAAELFESLLVAMGFAWEHDYSDNLWVLRDSRQYEVSGEFPRIVAAALPPGVHQVRYLLDLAQCAPFAVGPEALYESIETNGEA